MNNFWKNAYVMQLIHECSYVRNDIAQVIILAIIKSGKMYLIC